jgi:hypothetical protein
MRILSPFSEALLPGLLPLRLREGTRLSAYATIGAVVAPNSNFTAWSSLAPSKPSLAIIAFIARRLLAADILKWGESDEFTNCTWSSRNGSIWNM